MVGAALWLPRASGWPNPHFLSSSVDHKCIQIQIQIQIQKMWFYVNVSSENHLGE